MESPTRARNTYMATLPPQMIRVEKLPRATTCETIAEESLRLGLGMSLSLSEEEWVESVVTLREVAPAPVIRVKKQAFQSSLDTIWEETMLYMAEYLASEAAEAMLRPAWRRLNYLQPSCGVAQF